LGKSAFFPTIWKRFLDVAIGKRQIEIFRDGEIIEQVILLKNEADVFFVQLDAAAIVEFMHRVFEQIIFALPRAIEHADDAHERRFSGARGAHDGDELAVFDIEIDPAEHPGFSRTGFIRFFDVDHSNQFAPTFNRE
jgi:hypothetical protein